MDFERIKKACLVKNITIPKLAIMVGISKQGLYRSISNQSMTIDVLEKIAKSLEVPIAFFFNEESQVSEDAKKQIEDLQGQIKLYEFVTKQLQGKLYLYRTFLKILDSKYTLVRKAPEKMNETEKTASEDISLYMDTLKFIDPHLGMEQPPDPQVIWMMKNRYGIDLENL